MMREALLSFRKKGDSERNLFRFFKMAGTIEVCMKSDQGFRFLLNPQSCRQAMVSLRKKKNGTRKVTPKIELWEGGNQLYNRGRANFLGEKKGRRRTVRQPGRVTAKRRYSLALGPPKSSDGVKSGTHAGRRTLWKGGFTEVRKRRSRLDRGMFGGLH